MFKNYSLVIVTADFDMEIKFESPSDLITKMAKIGFYGMDVANNFLYRKTEKPEEWENENWIWIMNTIDSKVGTNFKKLNGIDEKYDKIRIEGGYGSIMTRKTWAEMTK